MSLPHSLSSLATIPPESGGRPVENLDTGQKAEAEAEAKKTSDLREEALCGETAVAAILKGCRILEVKVDHGNVLLESVVGVGNVSTFPDNVVVLSLRRRLMGSDVGLDFQFLNIVRHLLGVIGTDHLSGTYQTRCFAIQEGVYPYSLYIIFMKYFL